MHVMISNLFLFNKTFEAPDQACHQAPQAKRTIARIATKTCQTSSLGKIYPTGCMGVMVEMVEMVETGRLFQFPGQGLSIDPLNQDFAKIGHPSGSKQTDPQD